jgi:hypothetical protein
MNLQKQQELDELYTRFLKFRGDCNVSPRFDTDLTRYWIIDKREADLIKEVLELLVDCGAERLK